MLEKSIILFYNFYTILYFCVFTLIR